MLARCCDAGQSQGRSSCSLLCSSQLAIGALPVDVDSGRWRWRQEETKRLGLDEQVSRDVEGVASRAGCVQIDEAMVRSTAR